MVAAATPADNSTTTNPTTKANKSARTHALYVGRRYVALRAIAKRVEHYPSSCPSPQRNGPTLPKTSDQSKTPDYDFAGSSTPSYYEVLDPRVQPGLGEK
ncbi:hypothetical protein AK830_g483 [Neonectria ditissima]|uniref:Uncharacterized protein n=1 Tax=Neonectria ditissima TaxID=78410 RepID=A0A0P7C2B8_9HYPO|nr:hypothetical protein AK830_g483 [Neonectria ditissima]